MSDDALREQLGSFVEPDPPQEPEQPERPAEPEGAELSPQGGDIFEPAPEDGTEASRASGRPALELVEGYGDAEEDLEGEAQRLKSENTRLARRSEIVRLTRENERLRADLIAAEDDLEPLPPQPGATDGPSPTAPTSPRPPSAPPAPRAPQDVLLASIQRQIADLELKDLSLVDRAAVVALMKTGEFNSLAAARRYHDLERETLRHRDQRARDALRDEPVADVRPVTTQNLRKRLDLDDPAQLAQYNRLIANDSPLTLEQRRKLVREHNTR